QEAAGWSTHPLTHDWWQPTVEALQQADPVPAETFAQGLEFAGASPGTIYAAIAAGGGARPGHVHLPPVARALADSAGYIDDLAQDLLLELFGGVVLARGVDRRADELRDPAREALDATDAASVLRARVPTLQRAPAFARGPFRNALRKALELIREGEADETGAARGWKLFLLLPRLLLWREAGQQRIPKEQLLERFTRFEAGDWAQLLTEAQPGPPRRPPERDANGQSRAPEARRGRAPDENEKLRSRCERATELIRLGAPGAPSASRRQPPPPAGALCRGARPVAARRRPAARRSAAPPGCRRGRCRAAPGAARAAQLSALPRGRAAAGRCASPRRLARRRLPPVGR
ncbi:unnamed protein product, partial [Prorocentrum cordatum]